VSAQPPLDRDSYSIRSPLMAREITSCWICSVPSKMSWVLQKGLRGVAGYAGVLCFQRFRPFGSVSYRPV